MNSSIPPMSPGLDFVAGARRALDGHRSKGNGAAFSALCRSLEKDQPAVYAALCLPNLDPTTRMEWLGFPELALRPSFRWGGLSLRVRGEWVISRLLIIQDPVGLQLRSLRVEGLNLHHVQALLETGLCADLQELIVEGCGLSAKGSAFPVNNQVLQVEMEGNPTFFRALSELKGLRVLRLPENRLGNRGLACLEGLSQLEGLELRGNSIADPGLAVLGKMHRLQRLGLANNRIEGPGLACLAKLQELRRVDLELNPVQDWEGLSRLRAALPDCEFRLD